MYNKKRFDIFSSQYKPDTISIEILFAAIDSFADYAWSFFVGNNKITIIVFDSYYMKKWQVERRDTVSRQTVFSVEKLACYHPQKKIKHDFYILNNPDWVNIVAVDKNGNVILVKQHRLGTDEYTIETVAGLIDPGEDPLQAASRELLEETGYKAETFILLKKLAANPAIMNNYIYFYCALDAHKVANQALDLAEDIEIVTLQTGEVINNMKNGAINHSIIVTALLLFFMSPYCSFPKEDIVIY